MHSPRPDSAQPEPAQLAWFDVYSGLQATACSTLFFALQPAACNAQGKARSPGQARASFLPQAQALSLLHHWCRCICTHLSVP